MRRSLRALVPYDAMALYLRDGAHLLPEYTDGDDFRSFTSIKIPWGEGLSGWVAENGKAIANGNPSVEPGYLNDPSRFSSLRSALAVPMIGPKGILGVVSLYSKDANAFTERNLTALTAFSTVIAAAIGRHKEVMTTAPVGCVANTFIKR
jgi:GAF domain-containing protein